MQTIYEESSVIKLSKYFGPAKVVSFNKGDYVAALLFQSSNGEEIVYGKLAIPKCPEIFEGDTVLIAGNDTNNLYIIGFLNHAISNDMESERLTSASGAYTSINKTSNKEKIQVCNKSDELIFEYDIESGNTRINIEHGDLEFITKDGKINFISEQDIYFKSNQNISLESQFGIRMSVINKIGNALSHLSFNQRKIRMSSPGLSITAQRSDIYSEDMKYVGGKFNATIKYSKLIIGRLETIVNDIITKAKNIFNTVDGLAQFKAGRMRTLVKSTLHIKAQNTYLKSEKDFKINGEKIHLG